MYKTYVILRVDPSGAPSQTTIKVPVEGPESDVSLFAIKTLGYDEYQKLMMEAKYYFLINPDHSQGPDMNGSPLRPLSEVVSPDKLEPEGKTLSSQISDFARSCAKEIDDQLIKALFDADRVTFIKWLREYLSHPDNFTEHIDQAEAAIREIASDSDYEDYWKRLVDTFVSLADNSILIEHLDNDELAEYVQDNFQITPINRRRTKRSR